jgi:hypothetical protein
MRLAFRAGRYVYRFWKALISMSVILSFLGAAILWPAIDISIGTKLGNIDPLDTRFTAHNESMYTLSEVRYICNYRPKQKLDQKDVIAYTHFDIDVYELHKNSRLSLYCGMPVSLPETSSAFLTIEVFYKIPVWWGELSDSAVFLMKRNIDTGQVEWLPAGGGGDSKETLKFLLDHEPP